jgi:RNA polymerase sigma-70 factor, ECF subfamily
MTYGHNTTDVPDSSAPSSTAASLLDRVKCQDPEAWQRLVRLYGPLVYGLCRRSGLQAADAVDVAQDTFAAVAAGIAGFRLEKPADSFRAWTWTIAQNKIRDFFRRRRDRDHGEGGTAAVRRLGQMAADPDPSTAAGQGDVGTQLQRRAIELVRAGVEERTWQAFWRVAVDGQSAAVVAEELGMSISAVYDAGYRIRRRIRTELDGLIDPVPSPSGGNHLPGLADGSGEPNVGLRSHPRGVGQPGPPDLG